MKKKVMLTVLSSLLALGVVTACGEVEDEPINEDPMMENNDMGEDNAGGGNT